MRKIFILIIYVFLIVSFAEINAAQKEGDTLKFWSVTYIDWSSNDTQYQITAVCKKVGQHCYFFYDILDSSGVTQESIDAFVSKYDTSYYNKLTNLYGPCPDALDNDPNIFILAIKQPWWGGYFDPAQQMPDTMVSRIWGKHSSEHEIIYINASSVSPGREPILAHEFGHMLGWLQDHSPEPPDNPTYYWEDTWVDEGFSTFADLYTRENIDSGRFQTQVFFNLSDKISLINWTDNLNYNVSMLFMLYMYEHYGKDAYIQALLRNQLNGIDGVQSTLYHLGYDISFNDVFENWTLANYLDNPNIKQGLYSYHHFDFQPAVNRYSDTLYPASHSDSLPAYSSDYILLNPTDSIQDLKLNFSGDESSKFRLALIVTKNSDSTTEIIDVPLNSKNEAEYRILGFGSNINRVVPVVMNTDSSLKVNQYARYNLSLQPFDAGLADNSNDIPISDNYNKTNDEIKIQFSVLSYEKKKN